MALGGVATGSVYLYFTSKEELFKAVVRENIGGRFPEWHAEFEAYQASFDGGEHA